MNDIQQRQTEVEAFKVLVRSMFPNSTDITYASSDFVSHSFACRMKLGVWNSVDVIATYFPYWALGKSVNEGDQYWVTNFHKLTAKDSGACAGKVVMMGQHITYSEKTAIQFLKRVKTFLESGDWK